MSLPINPSQPFNAYSRPASTSPNLASPVEVNPTTQATSAVSGEQPASDPVQQYLTPKNLLIAAGGVVALIVAGLGIRNRNWKFWEDATQNKALQNKVAELETQLAKQAEVVEAYVSEVSYTGGNPHGIPESSEGSLKRGFRWRNPLKKDPIVKRANIAEVLKQEGVTFEPNKGGYLLNGKPINPLAELVDNELYLARANNKAPDFTALLDKYPQLRVLVKEKEGYVRVSNLETGVVSYVPHAKKWDSSSVPYGEMRDLIENKIFVLPPNEQSSNFNRFTARFSVPKHRYGHRVYRNGEAVQFLPGLLEPNK
jgi:hypothetical protein